MQANLRSWAPGRKFSGGAAKHFGRYMTNNARDKGGSQAVKPAI